MGKMKHFRGFSIQKGDIQIKVNFDRFSHQYQEAQYELDTAVMKSMVPFMPHETGTQINKALAESAALAGTGKVLAAAPPKGRFLYEGKVMVDPETNSPWARKGAKKVVTDKDLQFGNPKATPHWFDTAKKKDGKDWVKQTKKTAGGG